jgi:hypothetical protein
MDLPLFRHERYMRSACEIFTLGTVLPLPGQAWSSTTGSLGLGVLDWPILGVEKLLSSYERSRQQNCDESNHGHDPSIGRRPYSQNVTHVPSIKSADLLLSVCTGEGLDAVEKQWRAPAA